MSATATARAQEWRRLSPLMLLVYPVREVARAIPALIGLVVAGRASRPPARLDR